MKPAIDRRFSLDEVREALRYLGTGHARAKIVGTVAGGDTQTFPRRGTRRLKHV